MNQEATDPAKNTSPQRGQREPDGDKNPSLPNEAEWLSVVQQKVNGLRFGVVQVTIHDGKVVQIESTEKTRFDVSGENSRRSRADERR